MKLSLGHTQFRPTFRVFTFFAIGTYLQTIAMQGEQMSITYIVVLGFEAITAFSLSVLFLKEGSSKVKLVGIGLVLTGITLLRRSNG